MLKNEARAPSGAIANGRNLGLFALVTIWATAQIKTIFPIVIDPSSGLPVDGSTEGQQIVICVALGALGVVAGFCTTVVRNVRAASGGENLSARLGKWISGLLP